MWRKSGWILLVTAVVLVIFGWKYPRYLMERGSVVEGIKITSAVTLKELDAMKFDSSRSWVTPGANNLGNERSMRRMMAHPNSGHSKVNNLCKNQSQIILYSKPTEKFANRFFSDLQNSVGDCKLPDGVTCLYTIDDGLYGTADVLFIHECFSARETPAYPEQLVARFNYGPEIKFRPCNNRTIQKADIKINYHTSSSVPWLYLCLPENKQPVMDALRLDIPSNRSGIAMFVSDCKPSFSKWRYKYLKELMKYIDIDSYGTCLHNAKMESTRWDNEKFNIKVDILVKKRYKFLIAFENSPVSEYITEKIWHAYMSQTIPIYYGAPEVYNQVPGRNTFIDAAKFPGPKQLAEYIKKVDRNSQLYRSFFDFDISKLEAFEKSWCSEMSSSCLICNKAYHMKKSRCNI